MRHLLDRIQHVRRLMEQEGGVPAGQFTDFVQGVYEDLGPLDEIIQQLSTPYANTQDLISDVISDVRRDGGFDTSQARRLRQGMRQFMFGNAQISRGKPMPAGKLGELYGNFASVRGTAGGDSGLYGVVNRVGGDTTGLSTEYRNSSPYSNWKEEAMSRSERELMKNLVDMGNSMKGRVGTLVRAIEDLQTTINDLLDKLSNIPPESNIGQNTSDFINDQYWESFSKMYGRISDNVFSVAFTLDGLGWGVLKRSTEESRKRRDEHLILEQQGAGWLNDEEIGPLVDPIVL